MTDTDFAKILTGTGDLGKAALATRMLVSRMRIEVRTKPAELAAKINELKAFIAKNDFARADFANL